MLLGFFSQLVSARVQEAGGRQGEDVHHIAPAGIKPETVQLQYMVPAQTLQLPVLPKTSQV